MIRKTLVLGILALFTLAAAAPVLVGFYLEREFTGTVARFERPGIMRVVSSRFERGWLQSHAEIRVRLEDALCARTPCPEVNLGSVVHHGPIPFAAPVQPGEDLQPALGVAVTRIDVAALWPRLLFEPALAPLRIVTRFGFESRARVRLHAAGGRIEVTRQRTLAEIETSAVRGDARISFVDAGTAAELQWPAFKIVGAQGGQLSWRQLAWQGTAATAAGGARQMLRVESVRIANREGRSVLLRNMRWQVQSLPSSDERISAKLSARASKIAFAGDEYGPLIVQASLHAIDPRTWRLFATPPGDKNRVSPRANAPVERDPPATAALIGGSGIDISRLRLTTPAGDIRGHLRIEAPAKPQPWRFLADLVSQLDVDFALRMPTPTARELTEQQLRAANDSPYATAETDIDRALTDLVNRGLVERVSGEHVYQLRLRIDNGRLTLNGRLQSGWQSVIDRFEAARERL